MIAFCFKMLWVQGGGGQERIQGDCLGSCRNLGESSRSLGLSLRSLQEADGSLRPGVDESWMRVGRNEGTTWG